MADPPASPLRSYLAVLSRHRWVVLIIVILTPLSAFLITRSQQASYSASADVLTDRLSLPAAAGGDATDAERAAATQEKLARTPAVAQHVVQAGHLDLTSREFLDRSSVSATTGADLLTFTVRDPDPNVPWPSRPHTPASSRGTGSNSAAAPSERLARISNAA